MKRISMFTGVCSLSTAYLVTTISHVSQLQGDFLGSLLWVLAIFPGAMCSAALIRGAMQRRIAHVGLAVRSSRSWLNTLGLSKFR